MFSHLQKVWLRICSPTKALGCYHQLFQLKPQGMFKYVSPTKRGVPFLSNSRKIGVSKKEEQPKTDDIYPIVKQSIRGIETGHRKHQI